jgi:hypothetical protein
MLSSLFSADERTGLRIAWAAASVLDEKPQPLFPDGERTAGVASPDSISRVLV